MKLQFLLLAFFALIPFIQGERCQDEEPLPETLTTNALGDFHLHGEFRTDFLSTVIVNFTIEKESYFRIFVDELKIADVDLWLRRRSDHSLVDYSINYYEEEMISIFFSYSSSSSSLSLLMS